MRPSLIAAACGVALALAGCAAPDRVPEAVRAAGAIEDPTRRLAALAEIEAVGVGVADERLLRAARLIDPGLPEPIPQGSAEFRRAARPLAQVLGANPINPPLSEIEAPGPADVEEAARLYARAKAARVEGDAGRSSALLEQALTLDPGSARLWQELGETRLSAGDRAGAVDALTMAAELGADDPRVMLTLASDAAARSDSDEVVRWAGAAWGASEPESLERALSGAMLGSALIERGDLLAGAEALQAAASFLDARTVRGGEPVELVRLRNQRAELAVRLGDAWAAMGRPRRAADAYAAPGDDPATPRVPVQLTQRALAAGVVAGRPARAALEAVEHLDRAAGDLGPEQTGWLRGLLTVPRIDDAVAGAVERMAADPSRPPTARRQLLRALVGASADPDDALALIGRHPGVARHPDVAADALASVVPAQRVRMAAQAVAAHPGAASAWAGPLCRSVERPLDEARALLASRRPGEITLGLALALELERPDLADSVVDAGPRPGVDALAGAKLAGVGGLWRVADAWLDAARALASSDPTRRPDLFDALLACQRLDEAAALAESISADADATPDLLLMAADFALSRQDAHGAMARLERAAEADPYDGRVWERRFGLRAGESPLTDETEAMALGREISERRPRSALFAVLRAREMAGQGMIAEAVGLLIAVNERDPARDAGLPLLLQASQTADRTGREDVAARVRAWLEARRAEFPGSTPLTLAVAQTLLQDGENQEAFDLVDAAWARIGHPDLARTAEALLVQRLDRPEEAVERAIERLGRVRGVNASLELAETGVAAQRWNTALEGTTRALPPTGSLAPAQAARWHAVAFELIRNAEAADIAGPVLAALDRARASGLVPPEQIVRARLALLARLGDLEALHRFIEEAPLGPDSALVAAQALLGADRVSEALALLADLAVADAGVYEDMLSEWARLAGGAGSADDVAAMLERLDARGQTRRAAEVLIELFAPGQPDAEPTPGRDRADVAYTVALIASVFERDEVAAEILRLALSHDPGHAWAANDLGYGLAERGESLEEAERLLEMAHAALPDEPSVLDSLGWVRYKLGVFEDQAGDDARVREGAVTLLLRAAHTEEGAENATILSHLGDAMWRLGRRDEALKSWESAEAVLRARARDLAMTEQANPRVLDRVNREVGEVRRRVNAARAGEEPEIAPIAAEPEPPPDPGGQADPG